MNKYLLEHTFGIIQGEITTLIPLSGLHVWLLRDTQDYLFNTKQKALKEKEKSSSYLQFLFQVNLELTKNNSNFSSQETMVTGETPVSPNEILIQIAQSFSWVEV